MKFPFNGRDSFADEMEVTKIVLHLGAHKTATTFIQKTLQKNRAVLLAAGIDVPNLDALRRGLTYGLGNDKNQISDFGDFQTVILSDENVIGYPDTIFTQAKFYPDVLSRCKSLAARLPQKPAKIVFSIRPYTEYFRSGYAMWLADDLPKDGRAPIFDKIMNLERNWNDVVCDIQTCFPGSELVVSAYDNAARFVELQFEALLGQSARLIKYDSRYFWNKILPAKRIEKLEHLLSKGEIDQENLDKLRKQKLFGPPKRDEKFWNSDQLGNLEKRYAQDLAAIKNIRGVTFLTV